MAPAPVRSRPRSWSAPVTAVTAAVAALAIGLTALRHLAGPPRHFPVFLLIGLFALAELVVVRIDMGRHRLVWTPVEVPVVLGLVAAGPVELVVAWLAGTALALGVGRRQPAPQVGFNLAVFALAAEAAELVARAGSDGAVLTSTGTTLAVVGGAVTASLLSAAATLLAEWSTGGLGRPAALLPAVLASASTATVTMVGVALYRIDQAALVLLAVPMAAAAAAVHLARLSRRPGAAAGEHDASVDPVTGLEDATGLAAALEARRGRDEDRCALVFVDLRSPAERRAGAAPDDAVVAVCGRRLAGCLREGDVPGRYGPGVLAVVAAVDPARPAEEAAALGARVATALRRPLSVEGTLVSLRPRVTAAVLDSAATDTAGLLDAAFAAVPDAAPSRRSSVEVVTL